MERIQELSDALMARAEEVLERLDYAVPVKAGFENLVQALGETAERLASQDYSEFAQPSWEEVRGAPEATAPARPGLRAAVPAAHAPGPAACHPPSGCPPPGPGARRPDPP